MRRWILASLVALVLAGLSVLLGIRIANAQQEKELEALKSLTYTPTTDFGVFYHAGERFARSEPLYRTGRLPAVREARQNRGDGAMGFKYGPLFAMLFAPLAMVLPPAGAATAWTALGLLSVLGIGVLLARWTRRYVVLRVEPSGEVQHAPAWWGWIALVGLAFFIQINLVYGQTNLVFMALLLYGLELYATGRSWRGGALIGLVTGMRLTPLVFLPYFLWKRQWKAGAGMVGGVLLSFALPALWWGSTEFKAEMADWQQLIVHDDSLSAPAEANVKAVETAGQHQHLAHGSFYMRPARYQSLPPMVLDTFAETYTPKPGQNPVLLQGVRNFLSGVLNQRQATILAYSLCGLICFACALLCWRRFPRDDIRHPLEWALVLTAMLLVSPYSERTHYVALAPAMMLVMARGWVGLQRMGARYTQAGWRPPAVAAGRGAIVAGFVFVAWFNLVNTPFMPVIVYKGYQVFHGYVVAALALFVTLAMWLRLEHARRAEATEERQTAAEKYSGAA